MLYGSGYVLLSFLRGGLVERGGWLTQTQLLDAVAAGQLTPGPVFTTATFIGYLLHGVPGGLVATVGIFLPAFLLVGVSGALIPWLRRSPPARAFLDGVNAGSVALMAVVTWELDDTHSPRRCCGPWAERACSCSGRGKFLVARGRRRPGRRATSLTFVRPSSSTRSRAC